MAANTLPIDALHALDVDSITTIDEATENMIHQLRGRPTDLVELVEIIRWRPLRVVAIPAEAIVHWRSEEPRSWQLVLEWLTIMDVEVNIR